MPDYRTMFDQDWTKSWDLGGADRVVTITRVVAGTLEDPRRKKKDRKPVIHMKGWPKPLALNKTNAQALARMYGNRTEDWIGKRITLYPTTTTFGNDTVDCIRIRPTAPEGKGEPAPAVAPPPADEAEPETRAPGEEG